MLCSDLKILGLKDVVRVKVRMKMKVKVNFS